MKKIIVNKNTLALAQKQMVLTFREVYLELQKYLLHCFDWAGEDLEKKKEIKKQILEVGQIYQETIKNMAKSGIC